MCEMRLAGQILVALLALWAGADATAERRWVDEQRPAAPSEVIYGWQLMTHEERDAYRARLRAAPNAAERERLRREHHQAMLVRARERGVSLPDLAPPRPTRRHDGGGRWDADAGRVDDTRP